MQVSGQLHSPAALSPGKEPRYLLDRRLSGPQNRSGLGGEEKNSQPQPGFEPPIILPVAQSYTTELFLLLNLCVSCAKFRVHSIHTLIINWSEEGLYTVVLFWCS
jgi:hypothetical protein